MKKENTDEKMVTLLVVCKDGKRKITIPDSWKITYGKIHGGESRSGCFDGNVLRIYESKEKQRAIFTEVKSFMDMSIKVQKLITHKEEEETIKIKAGSKKAERRSESKAEYKEEWVDEYDGEPF